MTTQSDNSIGLISENRLVDTLRLQVVDMELLLRSDCIAAVCSYLTSALADFGVRCQISEPQICMALEEALANAVYHGNLQVESSLKEDCFSRFMEVVQERQTQSPWKDRRIRIQRIISSLGAWITIQDEGTGFNVQKRLNAKPDPEVLLASGRGLVMMKAFSDELFFNDSGNLVTLAFYAEPPRVSVTGHPLQSKQHSTAATI
jgi:anti-sigma regulatory factor (Ser/Thr protein kinase)